MQDVIGKCLCGSVRYKAFKPFDKVVFCHCKSCQRNYGTYASFAYTTQKALDIEGENNLKWYQGSEFVKRGFCKECGSGLF